MSSNEQENAPSGSGRGRSRGRGRGKSSRGSRGRGQSVECNTLQNIRSARQVSQKHIASLSAEVKKELLERKRGKELQRILLPDAPPRKRRTKKQSPEREPCDMVMAPSPSTPAQADAAPSPEREPEGMVMAPSPSTSAQADAAPSPEREPEGMVMAPVPSTSQTLNYIECVPDVGSEVEVAIPTSSMRRRSVLDSNAPNFDDTVTDWLLDSDSDTEFDDNHDFGPLPTVRQLENITDNDLTPRQIQVLQAEDSANDRALQSLLPADCFTFDWSRDRTVFTSRRESFIGTPGPTFDIDENTTPTDIFDRMFDVSFIDMLCDETNRYAQQKISTLKTENKLGPKSRLHSWTPTDRPEMIAFMALTVIQGLYPLPVEESYFGFNGFGTMPYIAKIMTYNRYLLLKSMLHFVDNRQQQTDRAKSKLFKIQPIIDYFNNKFSSLFYPNQNIAIDESLLKWHGRLNFAQKINTKAAQVGVKTYELCDSLTGYLWRFSVYSGKKTTTNDDDDNDNEDNDNEDNDNGLNQTETTDTDFRPTNATAKIVFNLIEPLLHRGHTAIMDNFYNCPLLARCLKRRQTDCYGTQRLNREFVPSSMRTLTKTDLRHGEIVASYCSDLSLMAWRDSNLVSMISTFHLLQVGTQEKYNRTAFKPSVVLDYNKNMGGIDRKDQYLSAHPIERIKSRVWYKKLFRRIFNCAIFNSFVIFNTKHKISHRQFRIVLAESLLKTYRQIDLTTETRLISRPCGQTTTTVAQRTRTLTLQDRPIVEGDHFPIHATTKRGRCWWCAHKRKVTTRTVWKCMECDVTLCIIGCFRDYHKP